MTIPNWMWAEIVSYWVQSLFSNRASACLLALSTTTSLDHYQHEMLTRTLTWFYCLSYTPDTTTEHLPPSPSYRWGTWSSELGSSLLNKPRQNGSAMSFAFLWSVHETFWTWNRLPLMIPPHQLLHSQVAAPTPAPSPNFLCSHL